MLVLALALAAQAAAVPPPRRGLQPGTLWNRGPIRTRDYEARVRFISSYGPAQERDRIVVRLRSGSLLREEASGPDGTSVFFFDFAGVVGVSYARGVDGRYRRLSIGRERSNDPSQDYWREPTEERDHVLGEDCRVWRLVRADEVRRGDAETVSCETRDGIQLWTRFRSRGLGTVYEESRTLSFRRRPVAHREIAPPADLLRWANWRDLPSPAGPSTRPRTNYDVRFGSLSENANESARIMRRSGDWTYQASTTRSRGLVFVNNRAVTLLYEAGPDGRPVRLEINPLEAEWVRQNEAAVNAPVEGRPPERVLGETCTWSRLSGEGVVIVTSGETRTCVTADGVPLADYSAQRFLQANLAATSVSRGRPPLASVMPPGDAFDWSRWGIRPAPAR
jgi:hypothetical protein